jgi:hypothetical protein
MPFHPCYHNITMVQVSILFLFGRKSTSLLSFLSQSIVDVNVKIARYAMAIDLARLNLSKIRKVDSPPLY